MPFNETDKSKPMSDFSLPYLKDIPRRDRKDVMSDRWHEAGNEEVYRALDDADYRWSRCMELFTGIITDEDEIRCTAIDWGIIVMAIILSFHNDIVDVAEMQGNNVAVLRQKLWKEAQMLSKWCDAIRDEQSIDRVIQLARRGIAFLEKEQFSSKEALLEYKLVVAREIREQTK